jgi:hypothetical protein
MVSKEIFQYETGFGYRILRDKVVVVSQRYKPCLPGFQLMTEKEANALADIVVDKMSAQRTQAEEAEWQTLRQKVSSVACHNCGRIIPIPDSGLNLQILTPTEQYRLTELSKKGDYSLSAEEVKQICLSVEQEGEA